MVDDLNAEGSGQQKPYNDPRNNQHSPSAPTTGLRYRGNNTTRNTGRSDHQKALTRHSTRTEERVTVQGPVKKLQPVKEGIGGRVSEGSIPQRGM